MNWKKILFYLLCTLLVLTSACSNYQPLVSNNIGFITEDEVGVPVPNVKIVVVGYDGKLLDVVTSDNQGEAVVKLTVPLDLRYSDTVKNGMEPRGTVTVIAFKEGYRQTLLLEAGVSSASSLHYIYMKPLNPGQRNDPEVQLANNHHLETYSLVKKYADMVNEQVND